MGVSRISVVRSQSRQARAAESNEGARSDELQSTTARMNRGWGRRSEANL